MLLMCRGEVCLIDWKTSQKPKKQLKDLYDYPEQAVAYAGAINSDKNYPFNVSVSACMCLHLCGAELLYYVA